MGSTIRIAFGGVVAATAIAAMSTGAAAVNDIVFAINGFASGAPGTVLPLGEVTVASELVGATCTGRAEATNQESVHPNNDVLVSTGASQAVLADIEGAPNKVTTLSGSVVLGSTVKFELRFGADGVSSGGVNVILDCVAAPPTTPAPPTTIAAPTTAPPTTASPATMAPATAAPAETSAVASASQLPETGSSSTPAIIGAATALIGAGAAMSWVRRRAEC